MKTNIKNYKIQKYINKDDINIIVQTIANKINKDYHNKEIILLGILNGCIMFYSDLLKYIHIPCNTYFIQLSSYKGTKSSGIVQQLSDSNYNFKNKHIIIIEDIIDTGLTIQYLLDTIQDASSIEIATLLFKKSNFEKTYDIKYIGKEIDDKFVIGYGMDLNGYYRNYSEIYCIEN